MANRDYVVSRCAHWGAWWVEQRRAKLLKMRHQSHAVNPFLWPVIAAMHGYTFQELIEFQIAGHLVEGHATGFGKLVDEKILDDVFDTSKLTKKARSATATYSLPAFDNVDHIHGRDLLSVKAGRWSIQLGQAVQLNRSAQQLLRLREEGRVSFDRIVIGVFYGTAEKLTDKYDVIRGLGGKSAAGHDVEDVSSYVDVVAGRDFWAYLNDGEVATQEWVLEGLLTGVAQPPADGTDFRDLLSAFMEDYRKSFSDFITDENDVAWEEILKRENG
jgi:hypothetical protein